MENVLTKSHDPSSLLLEGWDREEKVQTIPSDKTLQDNIALDLKWEACSQNMQDSSSTYLRKQQGKNT